MRALVLPLVLPCALACGDTGQPEVRYPAEALSTAPGPVHVSGFDVELDEAWLAFGPAYFCASESASPTLCDAALAELRTTTRVDLLDSSPQPLGVVVGFEGALRSASYDLGIDWFTTQERPVAHPAAPDGHSLVLAGTASRDGVTRRFHAAVDVVPQLRGQRGVPTQRVTGGGDGPLVVRLDPARWVEVVDFAALAPDTDGALVVSPGDRAHDALVLAITAQRPMEIEWR